MTANLLGRGIADLLGRFEEIWCVDTEFIPAPGEHPDVLCLCAIELRTGRSIRMWEDQFQATPPFRMDDGVAFVFFTAMAECNCFLARKLGWPLPKNVIDLSPMFRCYINGRDPPAAGKGLIGALSHFGFDTVGEKYKEAMRRRILEGRPFTKEEIVKILEYCFSDVVQLGPLLEKLLAYIDLDIALHWGEFAAVSAVIDVAPAVLSRLNWSLAPDEPLPILGPGCRPFSSALRSG